MRTAYSNFQLDQLEITFTQTQYPDVFVREELSNRLGIKEDRIQVWMVVSVTCCYIALSIYMHGTSDDNLSTKNALRVIN